MTESNILTPSDHRTYADIMRSIANDISTHQIPLLQEELRKLRNASANQNSIDNKTKEISEFQSIANNCLTKAIKLDSKAILGILTSTDVQNAIGSIVCSTAKVKLAIDKLKDIRKTMEFVSAAIELAAAIATTVTTGGTSFANIAKIIDKVDKLTKEVTEKDLKDSEKRQLQGILQKCNVSAA